MRKRKSEINKMWANVPNYTANLNGEEIFKYRVSSEGEVKRIAYNKTKSDGTIMKVPEKMLDIKNDRKDSYPFVILFDGEVRRKVSVARLVANAFIKEGSGTLKRKNGKTNDCRASNLFWSKTEKVERSDVFTPVLTTKIVRNMKHVYVNGKLRNTTSIDAPSRIAV